MQSGDHLSCPATPRGLELQHRGEESDLNGHLRDRTRWSPSPATLSWGRRPPRSRFLEGCSAACRARSRSGRGDLVPGVQQLLSGARLSRSARHPREDKAAVAALAGVRGWTARGARLRKGGFGRGTGRLPRKRARSGETKRARSSRARASRDGKSRGRRWLCCAGSCATLSSLSPPPSPTVSSAPRMQCARWFPKPGPVTTRTGKTKGRDNLSGRVGV